MRAPTLAIVVPVYREPELDRQLRHLRALCPDELIVVSAAEDSACRPPPSAEDSSLGPGIQRLAAPRGRALQMNVGANAARSDVLVFVHADTVLPADALAHVRRVVSEGALWGRFDVRLSGNRLAFRIIEYFMNIRSALTGIATGDQAIFVRRDVFELMGGFAPIALMEDIDLSARLKWVARPAHIRARVVTSSRRWEQGGTVRTVLRMWVLRMLYALGCSPARLAQWYK